MRASSIEFKDSIDHLMIVHSCPSRINGVESSPMNQGVGKKTVIINEERNETHIIKHGGDPLYKLELKQPKKGILRSKRAATENFTVKVNGPEEQISLPNSNQQELNLTRSGVYFEDSKEKTQGIHQKGNVSKREESPNTSPLKMSLNLASVTGTPEYSGWKDKPIGYSPDLSPDISPISDRRREKALIASPNQWSGSMDTFGEYYNQDQEKNSFLRVPERNHRVGGTLPPRITLARHGSTVINSASPMADHRHPHSDLNYIPPQNSVREHLRNKTTSFQQGARDILDRNVPLTDRNQYSSSNTPNAQILDLSSSLASPKIDIRKTLPPNLSAFSRHSETSSTNVQQAEDDNNNILQRLRASRRMQTDSDYQFMARFRAPRENYQYDLNRNSATRVSAPQVSASYRANNVHPIGLVRSNR